MSKKNFSKRAIAIRAALTRAVFDQTSGRCWYCGVPLLFDADYSWAMDHVVPRVRGGSDEPENLVAACYPCNGITSGRTVEEFRQLYMRRLGMGFTSRQREYWLSHGVTLPTATPIIFYGEQL